MKKISYLLLVFLVGFLSACSDSSIDLSQEENELPSFEDYFNFMRAQTDGEVLIQSLRTPLDGPSQSLNTEIKGNRPPLTLEFNNRVIDFSSSYTYVKDNDRSYASLRGANVDLSEVYGNRFRLRKSRTAVSAKSGGSDDEGVESVYIPHLIETSFSNLQDGKIVAGTKISWNFDGDNTNGVVIGFEYRPLAQYEEAIVNEKPDMLIQGTTVTDSGSYTVTAEDLQDFPNNAILTFYVGRAGYSITASDGEDYSIAAITVARADYFIQK